MQPKRYRNPTIALLNIELELKAERTNAELRIKDVEVCCVCVSQLYCVCLVRVCIHDGDTFNLI